MDTKGECGLECFTLSSSSLHWGPEGEIVAAVHTLVFHGNDQVGFVEPGKPSSLSFGGPVGPHQITFVVEWMGHDESRFLQLCSGLWRIGVEVGLRVPCSDTTGIVQWKFLIVHTFPDRLVLGVGPLLVLHGLCHDGWVGEKVHHDLRWFLHVVQHQGSQAALLTKLVLADENPGLGLLVQVKLTWSISRLTLVDFHWLVGWLGPVTLNNELNEPYNQPFEKMADPPKTKMETKWCILRRPTWVHPIMLVWIVWKYRKPTVITNKASWRRSCWSSFREGSHSKNTRRISWNHSPRQYP